MDFSIIIPTYKRSNDLRIAIDSILKQSIFPKEVIIVDNANDQKTKDLVSMYENQESIISFKYIFESIDSSSHARNVGAKHATGDILFFLDDDVVLYKEFAQKIMQAYKQYPGALIVQGDIQNKTSTTNIRKIWSHVYNAYATFFTMYHITEGKMKVLPSGKNTNSSNSVKALDCEWASGCCFSVKCEVFDKFQFDDKLIKYSFGEDVDFSYRIYSQHPGSIYIVPEAKLLHKGSLNKSSPAKQAIIMEKAYSLYFVAKNLGKSLNFLMFFWSELGVFLLDAFFCLILIRSNGMYFFKRLLYSVYAYYVCIRYFSKIKNLDIEYINERYLL